MTSSPGSAGADHLARRNALQKAREHMPELAAFRSVLIVEDETFDANHLQGTLHALLGYEVEIRRAATLGGAIDCVIEKSPDIVFLDDYLRPNDNATLTIPFLRRAGFDGPIVIVSSETTRQRRGQLIQAGAVDAIHKDELESVRVAEVLAKIVLAQRAATGGGDKAAG